jgi:DNA-binding beta-propeller fold protein YncE
MMTFCGRCAYKYFSVLSCNRKQIWRRIARTECHDVHVNSQEEEMKNQTIKFAILGLFTASSLLLSACNKQEQATAPKQTATPAPAPTTQAPTAAALPDVISFKQMALYPEGLEYDAANKRFLVTSLHEGTVGTVTADGHYQVLFQDPNMVSAIGIRIDSARDRVLVCNSDPGVSVHTKKENQGKLAGVAVFQLSSGKLIKYIDLGALSKDGGHFCNDIALDKATGDAYVTDSFSPIIYKIDVNNNASIFLNNDRFVGKGFNLNGIVVKDNYLIVAKYNDGLLFKVPLADPEKFTEVSIPEKLVGADGLLWASDGSLIVICNMDTNKVFKLTSTDNWASASVVKTVPTGQVFATTGVDIDGSIYVLHAMLHVLFNPESKQQVETFEIHKVTFQ